MDFEKYSGSYHNHFKHTFKDAMISQKDFARNPQRASVEYEDEEKFRNKADPPYNHNVYEDNMEAALYKVARDNGCRVKEVNPTECYWRYICIVIYISILNNNFIS